jgi:tol-pal system protein YbgF
MKLRAALLLGLFAFAGAGRAGVFDEDARREVAALRGQVEVSQKALDERLAKIEALIQDRSIELSKLIDDLKQDLARMRGQVEVQANQIENLDRRQKELYGELDGRLLKLQAATQALEKQAAANTPDPTLEPKAYEAALNKFNLGDYQASIAAFQSFLVTYPKSQQAANAQYWIGNAYYALRDYKLAIDEQQKLIAAWPESPKAPEALLNIASCQDNLNQSKAARETLQVLVKKYPGTPAADKAKQRLAGKR